MNFNYVFLPIVILAVGVFTVWLSLRRIVSLSAPTHPMWRRIAERVVLTIVVLVAVVVVGNTSYNAIAVDYFWSRNPVPGRIVDVGG
jgi:hypothetical protein